MNISQSFIRTFFLLISILIVTAYTTSSQMGGYTPLNFMIGILSGAGFGFSIMSIDYFFKRFNLRAFNIALIGLFLGCLMGNALMLLGNSILDFQLLNINVLNIQLIKTAIFLFTAYLGMSMTARAAEEIYVSIPFVRFKQMNQKKKDLLIDISILQDMRIVDLASSGLLNNQLILPRFILKELYNLSESSQEAVYSKARNSLEVYKKLETMPNLEMRYVDTDFSEMQDPMAKLIRLAKLLDANIITSEMDRIQQSTIEGVLIVNINTLANALKPVTQMGEYIQVKVQHPGKGARQGVGYLEDGTMVVINGGADNIGEIIKVQVLAVKRTTSGRIIFCNTTEESLLESDSTESPAQLDNIHKNYCTL